MGFDAVRSQPGGGPENQLAGIVDVAKGRLDGQVGGFGEFGFPTAFTWSSDGAMVAIGSGAGVVRVVKAQHFEPISTAVNAATNQVTSVSFSPDGSTLATGTSDGRLAFFDSRTMAPIGQPLYAQRHDAWWAQYRADGTVAGIEPLAAPGNTQWFTMPAAAADWVAAACRFAGGDLSRAEWSRYVGSSRSYRQVCAGS